jgi:hypothetical protein
MGIVRQNTSYMIMQSLSFPLFPAVSPLPELPESRETIAPGAPGRPCAGAPLFSRVAARLSPRSAAFLYHTYDLEKTG